VCKRCSRQLGNYYEAILQIRSDGALEDSLRDEVVRRVRNEVEGQSKTDRRLFITSVSEVTGGIDIKLSSIALGKNISRELADRYGAETKESFSLVGQAADGSETHRVTFLVRLPEHRVGDAVTFDGKLYKLTYVSKSGAKLMALQGFKTIFVPRADMVRVRVFKKRAEMGTATVVFSKDGEAEILHPVTYETIIVVTPKGEGIGETVRFVDVEGEILYFP
jgi:nonsense-mediated mRNA decay protein 3